jgi:RelA/SpoT family (p)ppGpp synthetase
MINFFRKKEVTNKADSHQSELDSLMKVCRTNIQSCDENMIAKAFHFCLEAYKNKSDENGIPYYKHSYYVALIAVNEMPLDEVSVVCALLHDIPNDSDIYKLKDIQMEFGSTVAEIVEGICKIQHVAGQNIASSENYRKLLLSLFKDVRIILIKIAEMLQNMRDITDLENTKQKKFSIEEQIQLANETMEIYSPFAHRFGLGNIKGELEDMAFQILDPQEFIKIKEKVHGTRKEREQYIKNFIKPIKEALDKDELFKKHKIKFEINGRAKHLFSIYNKIHIRQLPLEKLNDLFAIRIIIHNDDIKYCYIAYAIITGIYELVPDTFKNYIANPKKNGYQSLHVALRGHDGSPVEIQIRTKKMHLLSEKGVASHFNYKRGFLPAQSVLDDENTEEWLNLIKNIFDKSGEPAIDTLLDSIQKNWHQDEIYVFTPAKEFKIFPKDSTPLDFAYAIHSEVGEHCIGAKVNSKIVPLDYKLQSGDQVEIITSENQKPNEDWLKIVTTQRARNYIQKYFKERKLKSEEKGQIIWDEFLKNMDFKVSEKKFNKILKSMNFSTKEEFFTELGTSGLNEKLIFDYIKELLKKLKKKKDKKIKKEDTQTDENLISHQNSVNQIYNDTKIINQSECCYPLPGDKIIGELTNDYKKINVHRKKCNVIKNLEQQNPSSVFSLDWNNLKFNEYYTKIKIITHNQSNAQAEITKILNDIGNINLNSFNSNHSDEGIEIFITLSSSNSENLKKYIEQVEQSKNIDSIERFLL